MTTLFGPQGRTLSLLGFCALLGCKDKPAAQATASTANVDAAAQVGSSQQAGSEPQTLDNADVDKLLASWSGAQNSGQFEQYAALYASKFYGIKRAGGREKRFDRAGWLEDRKRMFQKPITVEVIDVVVRPASNSAEVEFTQRFATGNFRDEGPKRLLITREAGALKIAQEEMLKSKLLAQENPALQKNFDFHFLLKLESGLYMVLAEAAVPAVHGPVMSEDDLNNGDSDLITTSRGVREAELGPEVRALQGQRVRLDNGCEAQLQGWRVVSRVVPHFGERARWQNRDGDQPGGALRPEQIQQLAFPMGQQYLVSKLSNCSEGVYAQKVETAKPVKAELVNDEKLTKQAVALFTKHPHVLEDQKLWIEGVEGAKGKWWDGRVTVQLYRHPISRQLLASVSASVESYACSDIAPSQWMILELRGKNWVQLNTASLVVPIMDVLDVNGDGRLEFLHKGSDFGTDYQLQSPDHEGPQVQLDYSFQDCPC